MLVSLAPDFRCSFPPNSHRHHHHYQPGVMSLHAAIRPKITICKCKPRESVHLPPAFAFFKPAGAKEGTYNDIYTRMHTHTNPSHKTLSAMHDHRNFSSETQIWAVAHAYQSSPLHATDAIQRPMRRIPQLISTVDWIGATSSKVSCSRTPHTARSVIDHTLLCL